MYAATVITSTCEWLDLLPLKSWGTDAPAASAASRTMGRARNRDKRTTHAAQGYIPNHSEFETLFADSKKQIEQWVLVNWFCTKN